MRCPYRLHRRRTLPAPSPGAAAPSPGILPLMMSPEEAQEVLDTLGHLLPGDLDPAERRQLNSARFHLKREAEREAKRKEREAQREAEVSAKGTALVESLARASSATPLATGHAELETEARALYRLALERQRVMLLSPTTTDQDVNAITSHLRLAASIGQSDPAPTVYRLPMASLLGAEEPTNIVDDAASDDGK